MKDVKVLNRKGFTLIELLAVIIILSVLMMLAGNSVITIMANTRRSAFRTEFLSLIDSAQLKAQTDMLSGKKLQKANDTVCYCIGEKNCGNYLDTFNNKGKYTGSVLVTNTGNGELKFQGWMYSNSYAIEDQTSEISDDAEHVKDASTATVKVESQIKCGKE